LTNTGNILTNEYLNVLEIILSYHQQKPLNLKLMKAIMRKLFLGVFVVGIAIAFSSSCSKDPTTTCVDGTLCGKSYKTCASISSGGYYEYLGVKYNYTTDATTALNNMRAAMGCK
jgi:hypothetical protein